MVAEDPFWISGEPPTALQEGRPLRCMFKARYRQSLEECTVCFTDSSNERATDSAMGAAGAKTMEFTPSKFCQLQIRAENKQQLQVRDYIRSLFSCCTVKISRWWLKFVDSQLSSLQAASSSHITESSTYAPRLLELNTTQF